MDTTNWAPTSDLLYRILDWVLREQLDGREPTSCDVADQFDLTPEQAELCRLRLEKQGEL